MEAARRAPIAGYLLPGGTIQEVVLRCPASRVEQRLALYASSYLQRQLRCDRIGLQSRRHVPELRVSLSNWQHERADMTSFDRLFDKVSQDGDFRLVLGARDWLEGIQAALEVLHRYQRLLPTPLDYPPLPRLQEVLNARRLLTPSHVGEDAWRWLLRLEPQPQRTLELAVLFHDLLGPTGDSDVHATWSALSCLGFHRNELQAATQLASQARVGLVTRTPALARLQDATDLAFFSTESWYYRRSQGAIATRRKLSLLLGRMSQRALCLALATRQPPDVSAMIDEVLDEEPAPDSGLRWA